jgi:hypothetical protein
MKTKRQQVVREKIINLDNMIQAFYHQIKKEIMYLAKILFRDKIIFPGKTTFLDKIIFQDKIQIRSIIQNFNMKIM